MFTSLDLLLTVAALLVMSVGFSRRQAVWKNGQAEKRKGSLRHFLAYLISHRAVLKRQPAGIAHLVLFWGFIVFIVVVVAAQFDFKLWPALSGAISLFLDVFGLLLIMGMLYFLIRGGKTRGTSLDGIVPGRILLPALLIMGITLTGFLAEGLRLKITAPGFSWQAPIGFLVSQVVPDSPLMMQLMIRAHFFLVLVFVAVMPYTFMRHIVAASLNVYHRSNDQMEGYTARLRDGHQPFVDVVSDFSWKQLLETEACVSCGRCVARCPAALSQKALSPRNVVQQLLTAAEKLYGADPVPVSGVAYDKELWACTTCMACVEACPVLAAPADKVLELRRQRVMGRGALPAEARPMMRDLQLFGDTYGQGAAHRTDWALNCEVPVIGKDKQTTEFLIWVGCAGAYHPRYQEVARALIDILNAAGVDFAILGHGEQCCGDPARRLGDETLFRHLASQNIQYLKTHSFDKIITLCPHCLHSLKNEYPRLGTSYTVLHASELVAGLIREGSIRMKYPTADLLSIHDPCYLGRVNQVFEPLREIGRSVPGLTVRELERSRENGFCCGGGGGQMWLHETEGQRINQLRAKEVCEAETNMVATACPYCLTMLEDGVNGLERDTLPEVKDVVEIVAASMARKTV
ncbi:MAG: (Fe-S)-binding protein [Thermodesulfobacteriota bacterium]